MIRPAGGCHNCGGGVRTYKPDYGWLCATCVTLEKRRAREAALRRCDYCRARGETTQTDDGYLCGDCLAEAEANDRIANLLVAKGLI